MKFLSTTATRIQGSAPDTISASAEVARSTCGATPDSHSATPQIRASVLRASLPETPETTAVPRATDSTATPVDSASAATPDQIHSPSPGLAVPRVAVSGHSPETTG